MHIKRQPKAVLAALVGGTLVLVGGTALAVSRPADMHVAHMAAMMPVTSSPRGSTPVSVPRSPAMKPTTVTPTTVTPTTVTPKVTRPSPTAKPTHKTGARPELTYTDKSGDTLSGITIWFKLHGYGLFVYQANAAVIGSDPDLIHPGERNTISSTSWSVKAPK